jgi:hypothetical protein
MGMKKVTHCVTATVKKKFFLCHKAVTFSGG